jgi:hypothetical protein
MTFDEVCQVAKRFETDERFVVVAIGRFELLADIVACPNAFANHWGVNVVSLLDTDYRAILRNVADVDEFIAIAPQPAAKQPAQSQPPQKPVAVREARDNGPKLQAAQLSLSFE